MANRAGTIGFDGVWQRRTGEAAPSLLSSVFSFPEFEILFVLFFLIAFIIFKDLTSRPECNDILVKKAGGGSDWWPY